MKKAVAIAEGVHWVGAIDWDVRNFHGYHFSTHRGTTYNAYLVVGEKIALVDTVHAPFAKEMIERIESVVPLEKIDFVVSNHVEMDHSGAMPELMSRIPKAKVFCTQKGKEGLSRYYGGDWDFKVVKTGDVLHLGKKSLQFIEAPMLHWPDSMFTYHPEESLLLSNDAFGQHLATSERFAEESQELLHDVLDASAKYYANILWPFSPLVLRKIEEIVGMNLEIKTIAPAHGLIWGDPSKILEAYMRWAKGISKKKAVVVYDTMWGSTERMARAVTEGLIETGLSVVQLRASVTDRSDIIKETLEAKAILVGSPTINNDSLSTLAAFLEEFHDLKPKGKMGAVFGSFGWAGGAEKKLGEALKASSVEIAEPALTFCYRPDEEELEKCREFGRRVGAAVEA